MGQNDHLCPILITLGRFLLNFDPFSGGWLREETRLVDRFFSWRSAENRFLRGITNHFLTFMVRGASKIVDHYPGAGLFVRFRQPPKIQRNERCGLRATTSPRLSAKSRAQLPLSRCMLRMPSWRGGAANQGSHKRGKSGLYLHDSTGRCSKILP